MKDFASVTGRTLKNGEPMPRNGLAFIQIKTAPKGFGKDTRQTQSIGLGATLTLD